MGKRTLRPKSRLWIFLFVRKRVTGKLLGTAIYTYRLFYLEGKADFISKIYCHRIRKKPGAGKLLFDRFMAKGLEKVAQVCVASTGLE